MRYKNPYISRLGKPLRFPSFGRSLFRPRGFGRYVPQVDCPERGAKVWFDECVRCDKFALWHKNDGIRRCWHEFKALEARGFYDEEKWLSFLEKADPETFAELQEEKRNRERVLREMEAEKAELARLAEELARASRDQRLDEFPQLDDDYEDDDEAKENGEPTHGNEDDDGDENEDEC